MRNMQLSVLLLLFSILCLLTTIGLSIMITTTTTTTTTTSPNLSTTTATTDLRTTTTINPDATYATLNDRFNVFINYITEPLLSRILNVVLTVCAIALVSILLMILIIVLIYCCCLNKRKKPHSSIEYADIMNHIPSTEKAESLNTQYIDPNTHYNNPNAAVMPLAKEIDPSEIAIDKAISNGEFGDICKGMFTLNGRRISVALKMLKPNAQEKKKQDFFREAFIMGQFSNANVIFLYGVTLDMPMIVTPFMENGLLDVYLRKKTNKQLEYIKLCKICLGVASGMKYLSHIGFVHRYLAARNILLDSDMTPKISDFSLAREMEMEEDLYNIQTGEKVGVRWTAPEVFVDFQFNTASDVWSFGVLLWEVMSFGAIPYEEMNNDTILEKLNGGYHLQFPEQSPHSIYKLMLTCWEKDPAKRPTFFELEVSIADLINTNFGLNPKRKSVSFLNSESPLKFTSIEQWLCDLKLYIYFDNFRSYGYTNLTSVWRMTEYDLNSMNITNEMACAKIMESVHNANNELNCSYLKVQEWTV